MKRLLIIFTSLILLAASCQKETCVDTPATLTYTIVPDVSFVVKSGEEASASVNPAVNSLSYMVYHKKVDDNGVEYYDYIPEMGAYVAIDDASDIRVPITLIKDQEYKLVFIAQHRFESQQRTTGYAYNVTEDGIMSVNPQALFTSGDQLEAFTYIDKVGPITGNENRKIKLNRVVSQVNIGTSSGDLPSKLDIAVSGAAASYDIFNNVYLDSDANAELILTDITVSGDQITVSGTAYNRLATLYCLGSNKLALTLTNEDSAEGTFSISNVSTQVNYKTNIVGNIELARPVASVGETVYSTLDAAARAAKSGNTITLLQDVTLADPVTLPAGVTFNGNGNQITGTIIAGGSLTFAGHTKVEKFKAERNGYTITIPEGACLEITGEETPFKVGYGNSFIIGDSELSQPSEHISLKITAGILIEGTNSVNFQIYNTRIELGSIGYASETKATVNFNFNLINSVATIAGDVSFPSFTILKLFNSTLYHGGIFSNHGEQQVDEKSSIVKTNPPTVIPSTLYHCHSERA